MQDKYFGTKYETDDDYDLRKKRARETLDRSLFDERVEPKVKEKVKEVTKRAASQSLRLEDEVIEPLNRLSPEVIGTLFDRLKFLGERIDEINDNVKIREELHNSTVREIDRDVLEKETLGQRTNDMDETRNLKMDISVLRKEKRHENVQFWKDLFELKTELRELLEKYQTEKKIVEIFKGIGGEL